MIKMRVDIEDRDAMNYLQYFKILIILNLLKVVLVLFKSFKNTIINNFEFYHLVNRVLIVRV
jgi:hypothetical protein